MPVTIFPESEVADIETVDNVATLKALVVAGVQDGQMITTRGYYTENDGGQGTYIYDSGSVAADNGGTVIAPTVGAGRYLLQVAGSVNVRQFGAKGDGATDDLLPFRAAVAYINSIGGGTMFVPNGNFAFGLVHSGSFDMTKTIQLCSDINIVMSAGTTMSVLGAWSAGAKYALFTISASGLYPTPSNINIDGNGAVLSGINPNQANDPDVTHGLLFLDENASGIRIRNLTVNSWGTCAKLNGSNVEVVGCTFSNGNNNCVALTDGSNVRFDGCRFTGCSAPAGGNCVQAGLDVEANAGETVDGLSISDCRFDSNGKKGIFFQNGNGSSTDVSIIGCLFEDNGNFGAAVSGSASSTISNVVISSNKFRNNGTLAVANDSQLILSTASGFSVTGNEINGNSTNAFGIRVVFATNGSISSNTIRNCGGATNIAALQVVTCTGVSISSNDVAGGSEHGVLVQGGSGISLTANIVSQTGKELVVVRNDATAITFSANTFAEPCLVANGQFVVCSTEQSGYLTFSANRFLESLKYNSGIVAAYSAGPPTTIQLADLASAQDDYYNGYYVLIGASRIQVTDYVGSTRTATLASAFGTPPTPGTSIYRIVPARSANIGVNSAVATSGPIYFIGNDFNNSGSTVPYFATTASTLFPTWDSSNTISVSATYTATLFDEVILVDASGGSRTINLPTTANGRSMNKTFTVKKVDATANAVVIDGSGAETIDGAATQSITTQWGAITIKGNATGWDIISVK